MIVLDTNVISEVMRSPLKGQVARWLGQQPADLLCTTAICVAEILHGIALLPSGRRKSLVAEQFQMFLERGFRSRVLVFDDAAAGSFATIMAGRRRRGRPMDPFDAMIGAIAYSHRSPIATRDVAGFEGCGVEIIDPWNASSASSTIRS